MKLSYQDLGQGITCIETYFHRPNLDGCYLVQQGGEAALIDTGTARSVPYIMELLEVKGIAPGQVKYVIPTHVHLDHAGGAGQLMQLLPDAQLVIHPNGARHMIDPARLQAGTIAVYGEEVFKKDYDVLVPVPEERVLIADDGFTLELEGRKLVCIDTPGHARHHHCIWDETSRGFFTGDTFGISYRELDTEKGCFMLLPSTPIDFDPDAWHSTLERLMGFRPGRMYLTHYCMVENPQPLAEELHRLIDDYAAIALAARSDDRRRGIADSLRALYLERLEQHGCQLGREEIGSLLDMDIGLCAQGLDVWLARREKQAG